MPNILPTLTNLYDTRGDEVESWLAEQRAIAAPYFYSSVDLRHSGLRIAPVDTNLFPAGFNNLSPAARIRATRQIAGYMAEHFPSAKNILIIPENHTRNLAYFDNLATLETLCKNAGFAVKIGSLALEEKTDFISANGEIITQYPLISQSSLRGAISDVAIQKSQDWIASPLARNDKLIGISNYIPDVIIMNNDMTAGVPEILNGVSQPIIPPTNMGWFQRHKSRHFSEYHKLAADFSEKFGIDEWLISALSKQCGMVDFKDKDSLECLAKSVDKIITKAQKKHEQYGITDVPYVYIKADSGTYGMGIMTVASGAEVLELNKKERNKMQVIKEGARVSEVIIQEGIPTIDKIENAPAEPMIYLIEGVPVGGMYRINDQRDTLGNLNAAGMRFTGMCDEAEKIQGEWKKMKNCNFHAHGIIASIAALAAGREVY